jgi:hypothetical protein
LGGGEIIEGKAGRIDTQHMQIPANFVDPFDGVEISFQEMALPLKSAGGEDPVDSTLKGAKDIGMVKLAGAGQPHHLDIRRVREAHHPGQIGCGESAIMAGEGNDIRLPVGWNLLMFFRTFRFYNFLCVNPHHLFLLVDVTL